VTQKGDRRPKFEIRLKFQQPCKGGESSAGNDSKMTILHETSPDAKGHYSMENHITGKRIEGSSNNKRKGEKDARGWRLLGWGTTEIAGQPGAAVVKECSTMQ